MKGFNKNIGAIYLILLVYLILKFILKLDNNIFYSYYVDPAIWIGIMFLTNFMVKDNYTRVKNKYDKFQTLMILSVFYLIIYFSTGLLFGYEYSPYSRDLMVMIKNIWAFVVIIIFQEKVRTTLINYTSNKFLFKFIVILLFIGINLNFSTFLSNFGSFETIFKYMFGTFLPFCSQQVVFTYLAQICGFKALLIYRLPIELAYIVLPIFPRLDWFLLGLFNFIYCFIVYLVVNYEYNHKDKNMSRRYSIRKPTAYIPMFIVIVIFISFVMGAFKYKPLAIMSNSMVPVFSRGDMVIVKKVGKNLQNLKIDDIIEYRLDNHIVIHRIIAIEENNGKLYFKTKGDNNNASDTKYVTEEQVLGVVKMVFPKIGYPTVWLSEFFTNDTPDVELG